MSAEATGWVFRESPYTGALFTLHLAVADIVNDAYGNELWASATHLAEKARISERSARTGLAQMVLDGLLIVLLEKPGHPKRYRFAMPANPCTSCTPAPVAPLQPEPVTPAVAAGTPATSSVTPAVAAPNLELTQLIPTGSQSLSARSTADDLFAEFWRRYPLRKAKGAARTAFTKALKRAPAERILAGAEAYANDPDRDPDFTKHPATWLNAGCWDDEPAQRGNRMSKSTRAALGWAERTS